MNLLSKSTVESLKDAILKGKEAEKHLARLQNLCAHTWNTPVYDPLVEGGYTVPGDTPGTMGVDFRGPQHVPRQEKQRWRRVCSICDKTEYTYKTMVTKTEPNFG